MAKLATFKRKKGDRKPSERSKEHAGKGGMREPKGSKAIGSHEGYSKAHSGKR